MAISRRFAKRYTLSGELEIIILKDDQGALLDTRLGPFSASVPPSSVEFPDWNTLITEVEELENTELVTNRIEVKDVDTWTVTSDMVSFNIKAISSTASTFTDANSVVTPIQTGEVIAYSSDQSDPNRLSSGVTTLTSVSGDSFIVEYQTLSHLV